MAMHVMTMMMEIKSVIIGITATPVKPAGIQHLIPTMTVMDVEMYLKTLMMMKMA